MVTESIAAARLWAADKFPYFASALFALRIVPIPELGTVAVDRQWRLYLDPALVEGWPVDRLGLTLVHHTGHLLRDHAGRASGLGVDGRVASVWTLAADAEVNDDFHPNDAITLGGVRPESIGLPQGWLAEEYLTALLDRGATFGPSSCGSGADGVARPWEVDDTGHVTPASARLLRCQVATDVLSCRRGVLPGSVPAGLARWAEDLLHPIDWRIVLGAEIRRAIAHVSGRVDYSYSRPSRHQAAAGQVILPSLRRPSPEVAIVIDTSASMSASELGRALAEVAGILRAVGLERTGVRVLSCDVAVHTVQRVLNVDRVELLGGGGTDMATALTQVARLRPSPTVTVVLTDGRTPWPVDAPRCGKVVVGLIGPDAGDAPGWARVVRIDDRVRPELASR